MGRITGVRGDTVIREPDVVGDRTETSADHANEILINELINLSAKTFDESRPVFEYQYGSSTSSLEILPEYEMDEIIESIIISANELGVASSTFQPRNPNLAPAQSTGSYGSHATPTAGTAITSQAGITAGSYTAQWSVENTVAVGTPNNYGLYNGATLVATSMNPTTANVAYPQPTATLVLASTATIAVEAIATDGTGTYAAQLVLTQIPAYTAFNVVTVQLGYNYFNVVMDDFGGTWVANGLGWRLSRHDRRLFTQSVAGPLFVAMMGHADMSGR